MPSLPASIPDHPSLYRMLIENSIDPVVMVDGSGAVVFASPALERVLNRPPGDLVGVSVFDLIHPDDLAEAAGRFAKLASGARESMLVRCRTGDDSWVVLETAAQALVDDEGEIAVIVGVAHDVTDAHRAVEQLQESEGLFRTMFDHGLEPAMITERGILVEVNRAFVDLFGYDRDDLIGRSVFDLAVPEHRAQALERMERGDESPYELDAIRRDGTRVTVRIRSRFVVYRGRRVRLTVGHDVTDLRRSEARFRELVDTLDAVVWEADPRTFRFRFVSRAAEDLLGYPREEWLEDGFWREHLHGDDRDATVAQCREAVAAGNDHKLQYRMTAADGRVVWVDDAVRVVRDSKGEVTGLRGVMIDTTERERTRLELARMEARYRELFEHAADVVVLSDPDGRIIHANRAMEELLGYAPEELIGTTGLAVTAPEDRAYVIDQLARQVTGSRDRAPVTYEITAVARDGTRVPLEVSSRVVHAPDGTTWLLAIARDIRARRELEAQLRQAQKLEAVGRLAGSVAHDFNNLLAAVISYAELGARRVGDGPGRHEIDQIAAAAERARRLTAQLLTFGRRQVLRAELLDVNEVVAGLRDLLDHLVGDDVELVVSTGNGVGRVAADRGQLEQVVMNLVVNAGEATPAGGRVSIETSRAGDQVVLTVSDTGAGIAAADRDRVFEPFFTTKPDGNGLGLSTVYGIVAQSGGTVTVDSAPGRGSRFEVVLPVEVMAESETDRARGSAPPGSSVLLVEDEPTVRDAMADLLRTEGHQVVEASGPVEALDRWRADPSAVDVLVTDVVMPDMTGPELYAELAAARPGLRAVLMSGYASDVIGEGRPAGTVFLQKPFRADELLSSIAEALADR